MKGPGVNDAAAHRNEGDIPPRPFRTRVLRRWRADLWGATVAAAISSALFAVLIPIWRLHPNVPFLASGDSLLVLMWLRNIQVDGTWMTTPLLGYPFGQDMAAWPAAVGDMWHLLALWLLVHVLSPAAALNVFYLLTFPLISFCAYLAARSFAVGRYASVVVAVAYALLPYHFLRGVSHLFLSAYFAVPLSCAVALWLYSGRVRLWRNPRRWTRYEVATAAVAVLLVGTGLYYAVFAVTLWAAAALLGRLGGRAWADVGQAALAGAVVVVGLALAALPYVLYEPPPGSTSAVAGRSYAGGEAFGLKLIELFIPASYHRIGVLARLHERMSGSPIPGEQTAMLGVLGSAGLILVVLATLVPLRSATRVRRHLRTVGMFTVVCLLVSTVGGLSGALAIAGFGQIRAWNRMSVMIAFLALVGLGRALGWAGERLALRRPRLAAGPHPRVVAVALLVAVVFLDQTGPRVGAHPDEQAAAWNADAVYFTALETELGRGAAVFNLPRIEFPEPDAATLGNIPPSDQLRGYLHSDLAWSYAGIKGQDNDWQAAALEHGEAAALPALVAAGFSAVLIDRRGYADGGLAVETAIRAAASPPEPLVSADGTLASYDLRAYAQRLRDSGAVLDRTDVLQPIRIVYGDGFSYAERDETSTWRWAAGSASAQLVNPRSHSVRVHLTGSVQVWDDDSAAVVTVGDRKFALDVHGNDATLDVTVEVPSGSLDVVFSTTSGPVQLPGEVRDIHQKVTGLTVSVLS